MMSPSQIWSHIEKHDVLGKAGCTPDATDANSLRNLEYLKSMPLNSDASAVNPGMLIFSSFVFYSAVIIRRHLRHQERELLGHIAAHRVLLGNISVPKHGDSRALALSPQNRSPPFASEVAGQLSTWHHDAAASYACGFLARAIRGTAEEVRELLRHDPAGPDQSLLRTVSDARSIQRRFCVETWQCHGFSPINLPIVPRRVTPKVVTSTRPPTMRTGNVSKGQCNFAHDRARQGLGADSRIAGRQCTENNGNQARKCRARLTRPYTSALDSKRDRFPRTTVRNVCTVVGQQRNRTHPIHLCQQNGNARSSCRARPPHSNWAESFQFPPFCPLRVSRLADRR